MSLLLAVGITVLAWTHMESGAFLFYCTLKNRWAWGNGCFWLILFP